MAAAAAADLEAATVSTRAAGAEETEKVGGPAMDATGDAGVETGIFGEAGAPEGVAIKGAPADVGVGVGRTGATGEPWVIAAGDGEGVVALGCAAAPGAEAAASGEAGVGGIGVAGKGVFASG